MRFRAEGSGLWVEGLGLKGLGKGKDNAGNDKAEGTYHNIKSTNLMYQLPELSFPTLDLQTQCLLKDREDDHHEKLVWGS